MNYYRVDAKCGHVGRNNYVIKSFFIEAECKKDAARLARKIPRVKHDRKDAIIKVEQISHISYLVGQVRNDRDPYFHVSNSSEQKRACPHIDSIVRQEEKGSKGKKHKKTHQRRILKNQEIEKDWAKRKEYLYE